jgi:hypothetical protein
VQGATTAAVASLAAEQAHGPIASAGWIGMCKLVAFQTEQHACTAWNEEQKEHPSFVCSSHSRLQLAPGLDTDMRCLFHHVHETEEAVAKPHKKMIACRG